MQDFLEKLLLALLVLLFFVLIFVPDGRLTEKAYISALEDYTATMADYTSSLEDPEAAIDPAKVAHEILREADIEHDEAFVHSIDHDKGRVRIYYMDKQYPGPTTIYRYMDIGLSKYNMAPTRFIKDYFTIDEFRRGYGYAYEWKYDKINDYTLSARLAPDDEVVESKPENYEIMMGRPLVETNCGLVDLLRESLPFKIKEDECFFVMDTHTRSVGWFYFRSTYNSVDFVGAYEVSGWDWDTTYDELMAADADDYQVLHIDKSNILIGTSIPG